MTIGYVPHPQPTFSTAPALKTPKKCKQNNVRVNANLIRR